MFLSYKALYYVWGKKYLADLMISSVMLYSYKLKGDEATVCQSQYKKLNLACGIKFNQRDLIKSAHNNY